MLPKVAEASMFNNYLNVFIPIIGLAINVLSQVISFRCFPKIGLLNSVFLGFLIGFFSLFLLEFRIFLIELILIKEFIAIFIVHLMTYVSLGYCYFHFVNLGETARRIRILRELKDSPDGLSLDEILERYNAREIVERRISRLIKNDQIIFKNNRYYISKTIMLLIARFLIALKLILLGKRSEFS